MKKLLYLILCFALLTVMHNSCSRDTVEAKGYIYKTKAEHVGHGRFRRRIYYTFEYKGEVISDDLLLPKLKNIIIRDITVGDSVVVQFPENNPWKNEVVRWQNMAQDKQK